MTVIEAIGFQAACCIIFSFSPAIRIYADTGAAQRACQDLHFLIFRALIPTRVTGLVLASQISAALNAAPVFERSGASRLVPWVRWLSALVKENPDPASLSDPVLAGYDFLLYSQKSAYAILRDSDIKTSLAEEQKAGWSIGHLVHSILTDSLQQ